GVFFFQAEDGIRDRNVTGVQTCALPILGWPPVGWLPMGWRPPGWWLGPEPTRAVVRSAGRMTGRECWGCCGAPQPGAASGDGDRSEERRVGKEGKCGWGAQD